MASFKPHLKSFLRPEYACPPGSSPDDDQCGDVPPFSARDRPAISKIHHEAGRHSLGQSPDDEGDSIISLSASSAE